MQSCDIQLILCFCPYLPTSNSNSNCWHQREEHQAIRDEAEMSHALWGHDLVQAWPELGQAHPLAVTELGVEAPHCDDKHHVADGPEEHTDHKGRDHQVPLVQVFQLPSGQNDEGHFHQQQGQEGQPAPQDPPRQERLPALGHRQTAEVDVQQRVADELAEEAGEGEGVDGDVEGLEEQHAGDDSEADQVGKSQESLHPEGNHDCGQRHHQHHDAQGLLEEQCRAGGGEPRQLQPLCRGEEGGPVPGASEQSLQQRPQRPQSHAGQQHVVGSPLLQVALQSRTVEETQQSQQEAEPRVEEAEAEPLHVEVVVHYTRYSEDNQGQDEDDKKNGLGGPLPPGIEPQTQGDQQVETGQVAQPPDRGPHAHLSVDLLQPGHRCMKAVADTVA